MKATNSRIEGIARDIKKELHSEHQRYLSSIIELHNEFGVLYTIRKVPDHIKTYKTIIQTPNLPNFNVNALVTYPPAGDVIDIEIENFQCKWNVNIDSMDNIPEFGQVALRYLEYEIDKRIQDAPITFTKGNTSFICLKEPTVEVYKRCDTASIDLLLRMGIGISISQELRDKADSKCKKDCWKYIKCALVPQECRLKFLTGRTQWEKRK